MNYDLLMKEEISKFDGKKTLLLHSCCGPCSSYVISYLTNYFDITVIYYNPSIEPEEEYEKRKKEQIKFIKNFKTTNKLDFMESDYDNDKYRKLIKGLEEEKEGRGRCLVCFRQRIDKVSKVASLNNYDYYATTLTVSPHKNSKIINEIGLSIESTSKFLVSDFKKNAGYLKSIELAKEYELYRQDYCGCLFSKRNMQENNK